MRFRASRFVASCTWVAIYALWIWGSAVQGLAQGSSAQVVTKAATTVFVVKVSSPANNSTVTSPVHLVASYNGNPAYMKVWIDHIPGPGLHNTTTIDQMLTLSNGAHLIEVQAHEISNNTTYTTPIRITAESQSAFTISPASASLEEGATQIFAASVSPVSWSATGDGAIDLGG